METRGPKSLVFAAEWVWLRYHARLREIVREWIATPPSEDEYAIDIEERMRMTAVMRETARKELRAECAGYVRGGAEGPYPIPV